MRLAVSVVVPVRDREGLIRDALGSVRSQEGVELEIIVVDDGSRDGTVAAVEAMAAGRADVTVLRTACRGPAAARNAGVAAATRPYLCFVDSDDLCPPGRIARQAAKLAARPDVAAVVGAMLVFEAVDEAGWPRRDARHSPFHNAALHTAMFRTEEFRSLGPLDEELVHAEDVDLFLRLLERDATLLLEPDVASLYRVHPGNMTRDERAKQLGYLRAYARSLARRRLAGRTRPLERFFPRTYPCEVAFGGAGGET